MPNAPRNEKNCLEMALFGGNGGFTTVFLQFYFVHAFDSNHTKGKSWNFLMKAAAPKF